MADKNSIISHIPCMDQDEIIGLNERLLQLLSAQKVSLPKTIDISTTASLGDIVLDIDSGNKVQYTSCNSPLVTHHRYDCTCLNHDSPVNLPVSPKYLPPIGVFWDIENCQVPKGRSAIAVAQVIRDKFFKGYREAEFIVVCDVQKENNQIMQELNDAQVNLIHVAATCKNAADEKLKQSIRRFADIHGSPSAVILISGDINFAADLSDLRHRKKIHVILLHMKHTSEALILCANEHYDFLELMEPLPSRIPTKIVEFYDLQVSNLPEEKDVIVIKRRLKKLSENCGGRVIEVQAKTAIVRFASQNSAERAQKRMDGEVVLGCKISVRLYKGKGSINNKSQGTPTVRHRAVSESEIVASPTRQMYSASASISSARPLPIPPYQATSPALGSYTGRTSIHCAPVGATALIQPPPIFVQRPCLNNSDVTVNRSFNGCTRTQSPLLWPIAGTQQSCHAHEEHFKVENTKVHGKRVHVPQVRDNGIIKSTSSRTPEGLRRIKGTHSSLAHVSEWAGSQQLYNSFNITTNLNGSNVHTQNNSYKHRSPSPMCEGQAQDRNQWHGQNDHPFTVRNSRTPSPYEHASLHTINQQNSRTSPYQSNDIENEEVEKFFNPINNRTVNYSNNGLYMPIELQVTNLDQNIDPKDMKCILSFIFMEHVTVLHISIFMQSDGNYAASIKVPSLPDAQYAISQLHRRKIGYKRILISYAHSGGPNPQLIRAQIIMLLQEVPGHKLPLFKFREMYESRFMISISTSELYKMKDVCMILEDPSGRMVALNPDHRNTPSPNFNNVTQEGNVELPFCIMHTTKPWSDKGWAEQEMATLPNVKISLKVLSSRIHQLLITHNGRLPLPSLPNCYEVEFKEKLQKTESGVPLEHLISCLPSIHLKQGVGSIKCLVWLGSKNQDDSQEESKCVSPPLANQLALFCRELVDLLKTAPHCQLPFNRFIPAYHHHFGRQCRVADYGFTKLIDLLEALKHTVQVMGEGNKRVVTLSHRAQVRRFTSDLLRVLKSKASKQVALSEFPCVYARVIAKPWDVADYGVCEIEDILDEVSESTVVVTKLTGDDKMIAIPKREQTAEEIEKTKQFAIEVVELLRHAPQCRMLFNKFVPSYHHHFGYQCRVSDYGFTKLIELFEAIPEIVKIEDVNGGERQICLTEIEGLRVLCEQISKLVTFAKGPVNVTYIAQIFLQLFGYDLRPELFGCNSVLQLMQKLNDVIKIVDLPTGPAIVVIDRSHIQQLALQCRRILMDQPGYRIVPEKFQQLYFQFYSKPCDIDEVKTYLPSVIQFTTHNGKPSIELTPLYCFACNVYRVLMNYGGTLYFSQFEAAYLSVIGSACRTTQYGFSTLSALLHALPCTITIKDIRHKKKIICLNKHLAAIGIPLPAAYTKNTTYRETDSSSESFESDSSSQMKVSNLMTLEEYGKWQTNDAVNNKKCWKQSNENNSWSECDKHWETSKSKEYSHNWSVLENGSQAFLKNLKFPLPPPKPESPEEIEPNKSKQQKSSVWTTPTKFLYSGNENTNVEVPPLQLPSWNQITSDQNLSNLVSPMKNLSAAANPLNPRSSPYCTTKHTLVIAPHPSELPLPALSLSPKKNLSPQNATQLENIADNEIMISKSVELINKIGNSKEDSNIHVGERSEIHSTSSKLFVMGKRRLAAQFNQPIES